MRAARIPHQVALPSPLIVCRAPGAAISRPVSVLGLFDLRTNLVPAMSADPGEFDRYRAALKRPVVRRERLSSRSVRRAAQYVNVYDSGYYGSLFGDVIETVARRFESEAVRPWAFYFPDFGDEIVVVIAACRDAGERHVYSMLAQLYNELDDTFENYSRRGG